MIAMSFAPRMEMQRFLKDLLHAMENGGDNGEYILSIRPDQYSKVHVFFKSCIIDASGQASARLSKNALLLTATLVALCARCTLTGMIAA